MDNEDGERQSLFGTWPATRVKGEAMAGRRKNWEREGLFNSTSTHLTRGYVKQHADFVPILEGIDVVRIIDTFGGERSIT